MLINELLGRLYLKLFIKLDSVGHSHDTRVCSLKVQLAKLTYMHCSSGESVIL